MVQISAPQPSVFNVNTTAQNMCEPLIAIARKHMVDDRPCLVALQNTLPLAIERGVLKESKYQIITINSGTFQTFVVDVDSFNNLTDALKQTVENRTCVFIDIAIL